MAASAFFSSPAHGVSFGSNLDRPVNSSVGCGTTLTNFVDGLPPQPGFPTGVSTCTWTSSGSIDGREAMLVPSGTGVVTRVQLKTGPVVGPMKVTVLTAARKATGTVSQCCWFKSESPVFTPAPNTVNAIGVNLSVSSTLNAVANTYNFDILALTVLDAVTPIPLNIVPPDALGGPMSGAYYPGVTSDALDRPRVDQASVGGAQLLMNAEWTSCGGAARAAQAGCPPSPPSAQVPAQPPVVPTPTAAVTPTRSKAKVRRGVARVPLRCAWSQPCNGSVKLLARRSGVDTATPSARSTVYGKGSFSIPPSEVRIVNAKLTVTGKAATARKRLTGVSMKISLVDPAGTPPPMSQITLERSAAR